jgi:hypothetical protein
MTVGRASERNWKRRQHRIITEEEHGADKPRHEKKTLSTDTRTHNKPNRWLMLKGRMKLGTFANAAAKSDLIRISCDVEFTFLFFFFFSCFFIWLNLAVWVRINHSPSKKIEHNVTARTTTQMRRARKSGRKRKPSNKKKGNGSLIVKSIVLKKRQR